MKCTICNARVEETFLNKIMGSYYKNKSGKKRPVCQNCQKKYSKEEILNSI